MRIAGIVLAALLAALGIKFSYLALAPGDIAAKLIWAGLLFPVLWPVLMFYVFWPDSPRQPIAVLGAVTAASAVIVALA